MKIVFPGGKKVDALYKGLTIHTDQPKKDGGDGSAPTPFDLFLTSMGTCAGFFVLDFCQSRKLPTKDIKLALNTEKNQETHMITKIMVNIELPPDFPAKYKAAVIKSAELCAVARHLHNPPAIVVSIGK